MYSSSDTFPVLGNITNPSDNNETINDEAFFSFTIAALQNSSGVTFRVSATICFDNTVETVNIEGFSREYNVVLPTISIQPSISTK